MTIGAIGSASSLWLNSLTKSQGNAPADMTSALPAPARSAAAATILPISNTPPLSFASILTLQNLDEPEATAVEPPSATQIFLEEARKSPMERMREQVLEALGLTEEALAEMAPEERRAAEDKIREMIEEKLRQAMGADGEAPATNADMLQTLA